ncbi:hypothetical protein BH09PLA1_BH09PLA1_30320 [soil metagenome]
MNRSAAAAVHLLLLLVLVVGLCALSFWSGTTIERWPPPPIEDDNTRLPVYGYVSVEPRRSTAMLNPPSESPDYSGLGIEQRTQAALLQSRPLLEAVISNINLETTKTKWFKSFRDGTEARQWLEKHFHAVSIPESKLIRVWLEPIESQKEAKAIVTDIVNTHLEQQRSLSTQKALDRTQALTGLKTKYEIRIRELSDRQNNLMLRMQMGKPGSSERYTTIDLELQDAITRRGDADSAAATARAEYESMASVANESDPGLQAAKRTMQKADGVAESASRRVEKYSAVLGDLSIAMSDYLATNGELERTRAAAKDVRDQLDSISAQNAVVLVDWAQHPATQDEN